MANIFNSMSTKVLGMVANKSDGTATLNGGDAFDVVIDRDIELIIDDAVSYENTATFATQTVTIGDILLVNSETWEIGKTLTDDGAIMTVVIS